MSSLLSSVFLHDVRRFASLIAVMGLFGCVGLFSGSGVAQTGAAKCRDVASYVKRQKIDHAIKEVQRTGQSMCNWYIAAYYLNSPSPDIPRAREYLEAAEPDPTNFRRETIDLIFYRLIYLEMPDERWSREYGDLKDLSEHRADDLMKLVSTKIQKDCTAYFSDPWGNSACGPVPTRLLQAEPDMAVLDRKIKAVKAKIAEYKRIENMAQPANKSRLTRALAALDALKALEIATGIETRRDLWNSASAYHREMDKSDRLTDIELKKDPQKLKTKLGHYQDALNHVGELQGRSFAFTDIRDAKSGIKATTHNIETRNGSEEWRRAILKATEMPQDLQRWSDGVEHFETTWFPVGRDAVTRLNQMYDLSACAAQIDESNIDSCMKVLTDIGTGLFTKTVGEATRHLNARAGDAIGQIAKDFDSDFKQAASLLLVRLNNARKRFGTYVDVNSLEVAKVLRSRMDAIQKYERSVDKVAVANEILEGVFQKCEKYHHDQTSRGASGIRISDLTRLVNLTRRAKGLTVMSGPMTCGIGALSYLWGSVLMAHGEPVSALRKYLYALSLRECRGRKWCGQRSIAGIKTIGEKNKGLS